jgi:hypothetical protein
LVIVDLQDAIRNGWTRLSNLLDEAYASDQEKLHAE